MKDVSAMLSLNYQFNENHSLGARYDYDRTPERHETVDPMNTLVYQDNALYEESHTTAGEIHRKPDILSMLIITDV